MKPQNCITHWEQYIAKESYFINEKPKGSWPPMPKHSSDESLLKEGFLHIMIIRIFWGQ
jgi:hypothetical protein